MDGNFHIWNTKSDAHVDDNLKVHMRPHLVGEGDNEPYLAEQVEVGKMSAGIHQLHQLYHEEVGTGGHWTAVHQKEEQLQLKRWASLMLSMISHVS